LRHARTPADDDALDRLAEAQALKLAKPRASSPAPPATSRSTGASGRLSQLRSDADDLARRAETLARMTEP